MDSIKSMLKPMVKQALTSGGGMLGNFIGGKIGMGTHGSKLGSDLGARISRMIGSGDYEVMPTQSNSLMKGSTSSNGYVQFANTTGGVRIKHREYFLDVFTGPTAGVFNITGYPINPGLVFSFPYLSSIAQNFEQYKIHGLVYTFESTTSPYNNAGAMGSVIMAMEYNASAGAYTSKPQMENSAWAISSRFDGGVVYGVECASQAQNEYYVRSAASNLPLTTTDLGTFFVATQPSATFPTNANIGELWIAYDIEFMCPKISLARSGYFHYRSNFNGTGIVAFQIIPNGIYNNSTSTFVSNFSNTASGALIGANMSPYSYAGTSSLNFPNAIIGDTYSVTIIAQVTAQVLSVPSGTGGYNGFALASVSGFGLGQLALSNTTTNNAAFSVGAITPFYSGTTLVGYAVTSIYYLLVTAQNPSVQFVPINSSIPAGGTGGACSVTTDVIVTDLGSGQYTTL